ncbi:MAG: 2-keto-4-pentenoate hydratase [Chromatiales bacterium]|jgi:2-keto-4-pentenoate hydratase/2-oxohepta-3-ene-1,7-dioic acid hydratase in catechol pathway|nr:2-keto-4-pentenoate hydratase [Chromatiales bacterium]MDP6150083.1 fumarylacetoacetate hydrolase family protein [Gammaproteobacteria bacterium]MDP7270633.1 fumarylacetoacetate hydrolase family protein [Gammaproteobacteria bacterium]HJP03741.1 fumarylacetoacetate hydrolase family protein [Gammaproteobacteria bacterium]
MFRLLTFRDTSGAELPGLKIDDLVYPVDAQYKSVLEILQNWQEAEKVLTDMADGFSRGDSGSGQPLDKLELAAPILYPGVLYCAGANYRDHVLEMTGEPPPPENTEPYFFIKTSRGTVIGPGDSIRLPDFSGQVDWEAEIGMVVGRQARNVSEDDALDYVAGFTILNDLSARDHSKRHDVPFLFDWIGQKCWDTGCPMGPWITPRAAVVDPNNLEIRLWINDELKQNSSSNQMIFGYEAQLAYLSRHVTLFPGDVIATGTPAGCGMPSGTFLKSGDTVRIEISGLGELCNPVI